MSAKAPSSNSRNCTLEVPQFVRLEQLSRVATGSTSPFAVYLAATNSGNTYDALTQAEAMAHRPHSSQSVFDEPAVDASSVMKALGRAEQALARVGPNPLVPLSTCDGKTDARPRGVDFLFPIHLADLSAEQSLLAGPVTIVGMLVRSVRTKSED